MGVDLQPSSATASSERSSLPLPVIWLAVLACLYGLLLAVGLLGNGFKVASGGGDTARDLFAFATNPMAGLLIGIMATALVQSSSTVTAIIVSLVASGTVSVPMAVPMIMGANLGTTVTNTVICLAYLTRKVEFRRAFAAATVHDAFNVIAIALFLPLELATGILQRAAGWSAGLLHGTSGGTLPNPVKALIKPVEKFIYAGEGKGLLGALPTIWSGVLLAVIGLILIIVSILLIGRLLRQVMQGRAERIFHRTVGRGPLLGIASGTVVTVLVQSSTTTTSLIVPMAGAGIFKLEKVFPFTVGANIGTCVTALLASLAGGASPALAHAALQIALVHLYFNLAAAVVIMGIPWLRRVPPLIATLLADLAVRARILAIVYVLLLYFGIPIVVLLISYLFTAAEPLAVRPATESQQETQTMPTHPPSDGQAQPGSPAPATLTE